MKITQQKLKQLIKEELQKALKEDLKEYNLPTWKWTKNQQRLIRKGKKLFGIKPKLKRRKPNVKLMQKLMGAHPEMGETLIDLMSRRGAIKNWNDGLMGAGTRRAMRRIRDLVLKDKGIKIPNNVAGVIDFLAGEESPASIRGAQDQKLVDFVKKLANAPVQFQIKTLADFVEKESEPDPALRTVRQGTVAKIKQIAKLEGETILASLVDKVKVNPNKALAMATSKAGGEEGV